MLGSMDHEGQAQPRMRFATEANILRAQVERLIICEPRHNRLINSNPTKSDDVTLFLLVVASSARRALACGGFGFARNTAATFDVFYWLQVTNYGVLYVLFDSAPSGSNHIDVWDLCLHVQMASPNYLVAAF